MAENQIQDTGLLLEAFDLFTKASTSLEIAYKQLHERAENLSNERSTPGRTSEVTLKSK